jgi:DNA polymerase III subunit beta
MNATQAIESTSVISVKVAQESFNQALGLVSKAVAKHGIQPVLSNILVKADTQKSILILAATDLDLSLAVSLQAEILEPGQVTIPAQKLSELVSKLPKLELSLKSSEKANITIECGRSKFEIKGLSAEQFPQDFLNEATEGIEAFNLPVKQLQTAASLVSFASDKRETNSILNGICLEINERGFELAATDGSRLAYFNVDSPTSQETKKVIIPFRSVGELSRLLSGLNEETISCQISSGTQAVFRSEGRVLSTSLIDGSYPKYQQLIPSTHSQRAIVDKTAFLAALERVSVLANERTKVVKLLFEEIGVLTISANTPDLGDARDQIDVAEYNGQDFSIAFNVNYMTECLRSLDCAQVELKMSEPLKPIIVNPVNPSENAYEFKYLYLLMPVQMRSSV